jgi:hypothetical protein
MTTNQQHRLKLKFHLQIIVEEYPMDKANHPLGLFLSSGTEWFVTGLVFDAL